MSTAGRPLELTLLRGARYYAAQGRPCFLQRQEHTPGRTVAHADLVGGIDGRALALEAKMTEGDYFPLKPERAAQRAALSGFRRQGADVSLVVEFTDHREIYVAYWEFVDAFLHRAWRRSLSRDWFMAHGMLVPQLHAGDEKRRAALWLDAAPHIERGAAWARVNAERACKPTFPIDGNLERDAKLDAHRSPKQLALQQRLAARPKPGTEEYRVYMQRLVAEGIDRQLGASARKPAWSRSRGRR
jgi:hypothetical protein